jgi:hypothetical protein
LSAKGNGQVRHIPTHTLPFVEGLEGGFSGPRELVAERELAVDEIANRLHT